MDENDNQNKLSGEVPLNNANKSPTNKEKYKEIELENFQKPKQEKEEITKSILNIYII